MFLDNGTLARLSRNFIVVLLLCLLIACAFVWLYDDIKANAERAALGDVAVDSAEVVVDDVVEIGRVFSGDGRDSINDRVDWLFGVESESGSFGCRSSCSGSDTTDAKTWDSRDCNLGAFGGVLVESQGGTGDPRFLRGG